MLQSGNAMIRCNVSPAIHWLTIICLQRIPKKLRYYLQRWNLMKAVRPAREGISQWLIVIKKQQKRQRLSLLAWG
jgi:hypothetical protein